MLSSNANSNEKKNLNSLAEFKQVLFDKIIPIKDLKDKQGHQLNKLLFFWRRKQLIPFINPGQWLKISFAQLIWIRILDDLRAISFPIKMMKSVCDYFYKDAYEDALPKKNIEYNIKLLEKKELTGTLTDEEQQLLLELRDFANDTNFLEILKYDVNYLTNLIIRSLANEENISILLFFDGKVAESISDKFINHKGDNIDISKPHIRLSITHYLQEFIDDDELNTLILPQLLNDDEKKVLQEMRRKNIKEIVIYSSKNDEPRRIESTKTGIITADEAKQVKKILGLKNYERITLDTLDDKSLAFKMTRKKI